ncbi:hypothetical protein EVAR_38035_1 [Eumeta japonica]|uniref:Uncharacterized protein n=1 Tax=Eumeta variegata TaxID=151549 RepID=A0A4C1W885_EUMVA|nr:hypothetical protein EVAR_38035_1 [Eumeta japonica]
MRRGGDRSDLRVSYTPEKANVLADSLSRPPFEMEARECCDVCTVLIDTRRSEATALLKDQLDDPELSKIIIGLENINDLEVNIWTERGYHMCKNYSL